MSLTVKDKKSVVLFSPMELFMIKEALASHPFYDEYRKEQIYKDYGIAVGNDYADRQTKLQEKMECIFDVSREWDFEGFEYR